MFKTLAEFKKLHKKSGGSFFDRETMHFFYSKIETRLIKGKYFIASEKFDDEAPRVYSVRKANIDGSITTIRPFQKYESLEDAKKAVKDLD